jgi:hypothetical protein
MNPDDIQHTSPTTSDDVRPRPTQSDHDGHRPTMSATRSDAHTMTTTEVAKLFENAALPRDKRSIERYCEQGKLDCFKDPDELRYYITQISADRLIGHIRELKERHEQRSAPATSSSGATVERDVRQAPTATSAAAPVKPETEKNRESETAREEYERRIKKLENENLLLKVGKQAAEQVVTKLTDYIKEDREHYSNLIQKNTNQLAKYSRRLGQLETRVKQLAAPDRDTTADDQDDLDDADAIEAEFSEGPGPASATEHQP